MDTDTKTMRPGVNIIDVNNGGGGYNKTKALQPITKNAERDNRNILDKRYPPVPSMIRSNNNDRLRERVE